MPRQETVLQVFVASPGDVEYERSALEEVIKELNILLSREFAIRLDLLRWETHTHPDFGEDAQQVINDQISDDSDIFIGVMWSRFGTPTGRAGSGTEEEFNRAFERYLKNKDSLKIGWYFKDSPISPSKKDTEQLSLINKFRERIAEEGGYY